jgi:hypothetical protein
MEKDTTMDSQTLDTIARTVGTSMTRRSALRGLVATTVATVAGGALLLGDDAAAKRRKKGKKGKKGQKGQTDTPTQGGTQGLPPGSRCQTSSQCQTTYICEVPVNGSNSDRYCSGGQGAICGAPNGDGDDTFPYCAVGYRCTPTGNTYTCQAVPDEM